MLKTDPRHWLDNIRVLPPLVVTYALHVLAAIIILIVGFWIAGRA